MHLEWIQLLEEKEQPKNQKKAGVPEARRVEPEAERPEKRKKNRGQAKRNLRTKRQVGPKVKERPGPEPERPVGPKVKEREEPEMNARQRRH